MQAAPREHLGGSGAEIAVGLLDELYGFRHRHQPGCVSGGEDPRGRYTHTCST
jgi:hypothetical protein